MVGNRLKLLRINLLMTQNKFSKLIGVSRVSYNQYENNNREMSLKTLTSILKVTKCNINWLLTSNGNMFIPNHPITHNRNCQLLRIDAEISAGLPVEAQEQSREYIHIDNNIINNVNDYYIFKVNGQSMEPGIMHQDTVIIRKSDNWSETNQLICAVQLDGEITLKRIVHADKQKLLILISDNSTYEPIVIDPEHSRISLIGYLHYLFRRA